MPVLNANTKAFNLYAESPKLLNFFFIACTYTLSSYQNSENAVRN